MKSITFFGVNIPKYLGVFAVAVSGVFTSCTDEFDFESARNEIHYEELFDFSTVQTPSVTLSISDQGFGPGTTSSVFFSLYAENPVVVGELGSVSLKYDVMPFYSDFTDKSGSWKGDVEFPAYANKIYAVYRTVRGIEVLEGSINDNFAVLDDKFDFSTKGVTRGLAPVSGTEVEAKAIKVAVMKDNKNYPQLLATLSGSFHEYDNYEFTAMVKADEAVTIGMDICSGWNSKRTINTFEVGTQWTKVSLSGVFGENWNNGHFNPQYDDANSLKFNFPKDKNNNYYFSNVSLKITTNNSTSENKITDFSNTNVGNDASGFTALVSSITDHNPTAVRHNNKGAVKVASTNESDLKALVYLDFNVSDLTNHNYYNLKVDACADNYLQNVPVKVLDADKKEIGTIGHVALTNNWQTLTLGGSAFGGGNWSTGKYIAFDLSGMGSNNCYFSDTSLDYYNTAGLHQTPNPITISGKSEGEDVYSYHLIDVNYSTSTPKVIAERIASKYIITELYTDAIYASQNDSKNGTKKANAWKEWLGDYSTTGCELTEAEIINYMKNPSYLAGSSSTYDYARDYQKFNGGLSYANKFTKKEGNAFVAAPEIAEKLTFTQEELNSIITTHNSFFVKNDFMEEDRFHNWQWVCDPKYRTKGDMKLSQDSPVSITMLLNYSSWASSLAYYYYDDNHPVNSDSDIHPILISPCTLMYPNNVNADFSNDKYGYDPVAYTSMPVGTAVQLFFYGYGNDMRESNKSEIFPAGTRIGFILKTHSWQGDNYNSGGTPKSWEDGHACQENLYRCTTPNRYTSSGNWYDSTPQYYQNLLTNCPLGTNHNEHPTHTCNHGGSGCAEYIPDTDDSYMVLSFEDHTNDENYNDVAFVIKSVTTIEEVEKLETTIQTSPKYSVYSFEDLWPSQGDYDMNDVMLDVAEVISLSQVKEGGVEKNYIAKQEWTFSPFENYAAKVNGFGIRFGFIGSEGDMPNLSGMSIKAKTPNGTETTIPVSSNMIDENGTVLFVTENVQQYSYSTHNHIDHPGYIKLSVTYPAQQVPSTSRMTIEPFIYANDENNKTWEVHLPNRKPTVRNIDYRVNYQSITDFKDYKYFRSEGVDGDWSDPYNGYFYVRKAEYPFAIQWMGTHLKIEDIPYGRGLTKVLLDGGERTPIDVVYPDYKNWVSSNGQEGTSWYLEKKDTGM